MQCPIRDWFATHEDGVFLVSPRSQPFSVVPPTGETDTFIYCTKRHCVSRLIHDIGDNPSFAAILHGGLPSEEDVEWLASIVGSRRFLFLGDADPPDLLVFSWLRERIEITYLGITDQLLSQCGVTLSDHLAITLSDSESPALPLVSQCFGDTYAQLGRWCSDLLHSGRKIELEALFNFATCKPSEMESVLVA